MTLAWRRGAANQSRNKGRRRLKGKKVKTMLPNLHNRQPLDTILSDTTYPFDLKTRQQKDLCALCSDQDRMRAEA